jgi:hypothetical protein
MLPMLLALSYTLARVVTLRVVVALMLEHLVLPATAAQLQ